MRIIGCDLHARQQTIAMLDDETGDVVDRTPKHEGATVREFYAALARPVVVGIEASGSMGWFLRLMEELGTPEVFIRPVVGEGGVRRPKVP